MRGVFSELAWGKECRARVDKVREVQIVKVYGIFKGTVSCRFWLQFRKRVEEEDDNETGRWAGPGPSASPARAEEPGLTSWSKDSQKEGWMKSDVFRH